MADGETGAPSRPNGSIETAANESWYCTACGVSGFNKKSSKSHSSRERHWNNVRAVERARWPLACALLDELKKCHDQPSYEDEVAWDDARALELLRPLTGESE